jgi:hypothetical protein
VLIAFCFGLAVTAWLDQQAQSRASGVRQEASADVHVQLLAVAPEYIQPITPGLAALLCFFGKRQQGVWRVGPKTASALPEQFILTPAEQSATGRIGQQYAVGQWFDNQHGGTHLM